MSEKEHDMTNDGGESVTYTLRNIPADTDRVITDLASHARKPKATFLREFLEDSFRDVIDSFALKNPLIASWMRSWPVIWTLRSWSSATRAILSPAGIRNTRSCWGSRRKRSSAGWY
ncbi:hypothetical protein SE959_25755 [Escherichia coli]|nr:hypothetical protein [Escherichia coli]